ncbi:lipopolysaccharide-induced tumor necrosis factor-alpha factor homolog [Paramacrobiotus metropolitanus]|uniref:lipopolysaccharide-induced tumor necrosis factor-alpha factor homolog n=1 Tax=Paramacrobiotus metropolitanus TaxID=2943436 RepID=UPI002445EBFA|nr:lipopolysaccharide-induced tumor necrosis factor-alpha factor homolog [Paramacrobiotus metropolitanus]XP_055327288.1 lipopolysaccharide-induced tumor necrosis factor-alpha factor homolog [Paramacrobiotus metropolitanus]XP_055327289.1 lipopolysaccharide-induced tumor necrosis factor-alpha factor homolog [Paramacrobiotus metropolitanus]
MDPQNGNFEKSGLPAAVNPENPGGQHVPPPPPYTPYVGQPGVALASHTTTVVVTGPTSADPSVVHFILGPEPSQGVCPCCGQFIVTRINHELGSHAYTWMAIFCILGGVLCFWIPLVVDSMQDVLHYCPNCNTLLGRFTR